MFGPVALAFGDSYNEDLLNDLAKAAGGALHDADSPEKFPAIFQQELDSLLRLSAQKRSAEGARWRGRVYTIHKLHCVTGVAEVKVEDLHSPAGGWDTAAARVGVREGRAEYRLLRILRTSAGTPGEVYAGQASLLEMSLSEPTRSSSTS